MARPRVAEGDRIKAKQLLLGWLAEDNVNIDKATVAAFDLHVQGNTFPGDEFMRLAADALEVAGIGRADPSRTRPCWPTTFPRSTSGARSTARSASP